MPFEISFEHYEKLKQLEYMLAQIIYDVDEVNRKLRCVLAAAVPSKTSVNTQVDTTSNTTTDTTDTTDTTLNTPDKPFTPSW